MSLKPTIKVGDVYGTKRNGKLTVIRYHSCENIDVQFENTKTIVRGARSGNIKNGSVRDPFARTTRGVGYWGIGPYDFRDHFPAYQAWSGMLTRSYYTSPNEGNKPQNSYLGCGVVDEWHNFQNFAEWFYRQPRHDDPTYELDKDLKLEGNKTYGPETCVLIPRELNSFLSYNKSGRFAPGVGQKNNSKNYYASISFRGKRKFLYGFKTIEEASTVYEKERRRLIVKLACFLYNEGILDTDLLELIKERFDR